MKKKIWISVALITWLVVFLIPHHGMPYENQKTAFTIPRALFLQIEKDDISKKSSALNFIEPITSETHPIRNYYRFESSGTESDWSITAIPIKAEVFRLPLAERFIFLDFKKEVVPACRIKFQNGEYEIHNKAG